MTSLRECFDLMAEEQAEDLEEHIRRYFKATGFLACGYCENPAQCHECGCWRATHEEMSEYENEED